jgi:hypothetical protein
MGHAMSFKTVIFTTLLGFGLSACSSEGVKRTTYETLQNIGEQQCEKDLSSECPQRQSYDEYRRSQEENR